MVKTVLVKCQARMATQSVESGEKDCFLFNSKAFNRKLGKEETLFKTLQLYIRSIKNKLDNMEALLRSFCLVFGAIVPAETWLTSHDILPHSPGYKAQTLCNKNKRSGGIGIYL